jgi:phosphate transport system protein
MVSMASIDVKTISPELSYSELVRRTVEACEIAHEAAAIAAEGIATGSLSRLNAIRKCEKELDAIDVQVDTGVTATISRVPEDQTRQLLACMKVMIGLERIGDLLLSFATSAQAAGGRLDSQDVRDLTQMATVLEKMLSDVGHSFSKRDVKKAIDVLRADAEMDRLRNIIFLRHIENPENLIHHFSMQVIFMTQSLERAGDHAKNLAEEVCHFATGRSIRHLLMAYDKPKEQMFIEWLRQKDDTPR